MVSSTLFGTVSGSAVANVVVDGAITIPMMKKSGITRRITAAAIEAVASNGGQIMPPVMGVAACGMAKFLNISYGELARGSLRRSRLVLYYVALFTQIHLEAAKLGLQGHAGKTRYPNSAKGDQTPWLGVSRAAGRCWFTLLMFAFWEAGKAGMAAVGCDLSRRRVLQKSTVPYVQKHSDPAFEETGRILLDIVVVTALAGLVIGALPALRPDLQVFALLLVNMAGGSTHRAVNSSPRLCYRIILGMSLPTTVVYIMLAVLVGPRAGSSSASRR